MVTLKIHFAKPALFFLQSRLLLRLQEFAQFFLKPRVQGSLPLSLERRILQLVQVELLLVPDIGFVDDMEPVPALGPTFALELAGDLDPVLTAVLFDQLKQFLIVFFIPILEIRL